MSRDKQTGPNEGARFLRIMIKGMGLTIDRAAAALGVERWHLWRYLASINRPNLEWANEIERVFGISPRLWTVDAKVEE